MLRLFKLTLICALALAAHAQTPSKAQLDADQAATLKGIQEIAVVVDVNKVFLSNGLTAEQLETDIELRLRKAGIAVVDATTVMREAMSRPTYDDETKRLIKRVMDLAVLNISVSGGTTTSQSSLQTLDDRGGGHLVLPVPARRKAPGTPVPSRRRELRSLSRAQRPPLSASPH
jgi:hypothetical protein